jgi:hypothetical protein
VTCQEFLTDFQGRAQNQIVNSTRQLKVVCDEGLGFLDVGRIEAMN